MQLGGFIIRSLFFHAKCYNTDSNSTRNPPTLLKRVLLRNGIESCTLQHILFLSLSLSLSLTNKHTHFIEGRDRIGSSKNRFRYTKNNYNINLFCVFCFHRANWHSSPTLTEVFPCFFLNCKTHARE